MCSTKLRYQAFHVPFVNRCRRMKAGRQPQSICSKRPDARVSVDSCLPRRVSAYGDTVELPKHEGMLPQPLSPYAAGKLAGEHYVRVYAQTMGLDGVSLRYFNIFGPRQDPSSPYSGVISIFIEKMSQGERPTIFGDGTQTRDFTYVANAVAANLAAMRHPDPLKGDVFNVGTGERISLLDLFTALKAIFSTDVEPDFQPARAGDVRDSLASLDRIRQVLGYEATISFREGLRRTVDAIAPTLLR